MDQEQQIEDSMETKGSDEEIRRLKRMVLTFKRKYQRALQDISKQEESLPHDAADIVKKCHELEQECQSLVTQQQTLKQIIKKNKLEIASIKEENTALQEQQSILKDFLKQKTVEKAPEIEDQQQIESLNSQLAEKEAAHRMAQQHVAKKMKEIVELKEIIDRQEEALQDLKNQLIQANTEFIDREKELKEEIKQWECKYHEIHLEWKDAVDSIQGLKKLEEKHLKMQDYLKNLGNIIEGTPPSLKKPNSKSVDDELDLFNTKQYKSKDKK